MNDGALLESFSRLVEIAGLAGLVWLAGAAWNLGRVRRDWSSWLMAAGAAALLGGRLFVMLSPKVLTDEVLARLGHVAIVMATILPVLLLTGGVVIFVWGLWGYTRTLSPVR